MTATEIVAHYIHLDGPLSNRDWPEVFEHYMLREFWQAAKLGAQAEAQMVHLERVIAEKNVLLTERLTEIAKLRASLDTVYGIMADEPCTPCVNEARYLRALTAIEKFRQEVPA